MSGGGNLFSHAKLSDIANAEKSARRRIRDFNSGRRGVWLKRLKVGDG